MDYEAVEQVVTTATQSLFRWEARGIYSDPSVPLPRGSFATHVPVQRVWVMADPHPTRCQQEELAHADQFLAAREDVRVLSETLALDLGLSDDDFWLIDDECVVLLDYTPAHRLCSGELISEPDRVASYRHKRDLALTHARPLSKGQASVV